MYALDPDMAATLRKGCAGAPVSRQYLANCRIRVTWNKAAAMYALDPGKAATLPKNNPRVRLAKWHWSVEVQPQQEGACTTPAAMAAACVQRHAEWQPTQRGCSTHAWCWIEASIPRKLSGQRAL